MLIRTISLALLLMAISPKLEAEKPKPPETDFVVLDSEAYTTETPRESRECGSSGGFFQGLCEGMKSRPISRTYHRAVLTDAERVHGYLVECQDRRGLLAPTCEPLTAGQKARGYVKSGKLVLQIDGKTRTYRILKSQ